MKVKIEDIPAWVRGLGDEDLQFVKKLVLASGSLKEMAKAYGVTYPTLRIRLNRLIEKVRVLDDPKPRDAFHEKLQGYVSEGKLDLKMAKLLLKDHKRAVQEIKE
ncbi:hypothetical protein KS4_13740 [Poriferisphaera corsica]|uniref:DUF2089 domain-containing protein n=1 Tax=Poriferisphaera corsica TaxID=2528020 RepID=A0A517YSX7_9BACT|nr:DUF2089 family protein [Poriferisphaera corsica]QDU33328.1 hypothetical protein KS4_13740 [Poriferisphaera corsica]